MKNIIIYSISCLLISSTNSIDENIETKILNSTPTLISNKNTFADSPFITKNNKNQAVLSWTEGNDKNTCLRYTTFINNKPLSSSIKVTSSKGLSPHHEAMPKIAFKNDGTIIAVYQKRTPTPQNRFAGAIFYAQSSDNGKNWTESQYLHTDTSKGIGRSFFDITMLPDGEIGAIWLDGRKRQRNGSTLYFAKTTKDQGFVTDKEIGQKTCQCCRTDIFVDYENNIHVAYRDIINDTIRDIVHLTSDDNGEIFKNYKRISVDNWIISGCPHTGPSITNSKNGVSFFWFTAGGNTGVFQTQLNNGSNNFTQRNLINPHARHPQAITLKNGTIVLTWDETFKTKNGYINKIGVLYKNIDGSEITKYITSEKEDCDHPVLTELDNGKVLISWTQRNKDKGHTEVYYSIVSATKNIGESD